jgi:hypothetical protein
LEFTEPGWRNRLLEYLGVETETDRAEVLQWLFLAGRDDDNSWFMERLKSFERPGFRDGDPKGIHSDVDFLHAMRILPFKQPDGFYKHLRKYLTLMSRDGCSPEEMEYGEGLVRFYKMCERASLTLACKLKASIAGVPEADMGRYRGMMLRLVRQALYLQGRRLSLDRSNQDDDPSADDLGPDADVAAPIPGGANPGQGEDSDDEGDATAAAHDELVRYLSRLDKRVAAFKRMRVMSSVLLALVDGADVPLDTVIVASRHFSLRREYDRADEVRRVAFRHHDAERELPRLLSCLGDSASYRGLDHARHVSSHAHYLRFLLEWLDGGATVAPSFFHAARKLLGAFGMEVGEAEFDRIRIPTLQLLVHLARGAWGRAGDGDDAQAYYAEVFRLQRTLGRALVAREGEEETAAAVRLLQELEGAVLNEVAPPGVMTDKEMGKVHASLAAGFKRLADLAVRKVWSEGKAWESQSESAFGYMKDAIHHAGDALKLAEEGSKYKRREYLLTLLTAEIRLSSSGDAAAPERAVAAQVKEARDWGGEHLFDPSWRVLEVLKARQDKGEPNVSEVAVYRQAQHVLQYLFLSENRERDMVFWVIRLDRLAGRRPHEVVCAVAPPDRLAGRRPHEVVCAVAPPDRLAGGRPHEVVCAVASALHSSCPDFDASPWFDAFFDALAAELRCPPTPHQNTWFACTLHEVIVAWMEFRVNLAGRMMHEAVPLRSFSGAGGSSCGVHRDSQLMCRIQTLLGWCTAIWRARSSSPARWPRSPGGSSLRSTTRRATASITPRRRPSISTPTSPRPKHSRCSIASCRPDSRSTRPRPRRHSSRRQTHW